MKKVSYLLHLPFQSDYIPNFNQASKLSRAAAHGQQKKVLRRKKKQAPVNTGGIHSSVKPRIDFYIGAREMNGKRRVLQSSNI